MLGEKADGGAEWSGGTEADKVTAPSAGLREDGRWLRLLEEELKAVESLWGVCDNEDAWFAARDGVEGRSSRAREILSCSTQQAQRTGYALWVRRCHDGRKLVGRRGMLHAAGGPPRAAPPAPAAAAAPSAPARTAPARPKG